MKITEDTYTGTEHLNKYIVTAIQNSRGNSRQLPCFAMTKALTLGVSMRGIFEQEH
jgi:hypothetical protein